jgi:rubrerythrin
MNRSWGWAIAIVAVLSVSLSSAGQGNATFTVRHTLDRAYHNEREAAAKYEVFAQKADEEGYPGAANLFRAAARAELVHAKRFEKAMKDRGIPIPEIGEVNPDIGGTADNLRRSASLELQERDVMYHDALAAAKEARDDALFKVFDQTRDTEVEHANLMSAAARQMEQMKTDKPYYVCDDCGYTTDVELPMCALCRVRDHPHTVHH